MLAIVSIVHSFLQLSNIPLDGEGRSLFSCSSGDQRLDCFHFLALWKKASTDLHLQVCVDTGFHVSWILCHFARDAITQHPRVGGLKQQIFLIDLKAQDQGVGRSLFLRDLSEVFLWLADDYLLAVSSDGLPVIGVPLCVQISSSYKDTSSIGLGPTVTLTTSC